MAKSLLRTDNEIAEIYARQVKTVYGVCFSYLKNPTDTEDAVADTFVKMIKAAPPFENEVHEKAWLIRTASNVCKDYLKHWWRRRDSLEDSGDGPQSSSGFELDSTLEVIYRLPDRYKSVIYLYYYEGYNSAEIAQALHKPQSTIRNYLHEARTILREKLGGDF